MSVSSPGTGGWDRSVAWVRERPASGADFSGSRMVKLIQGQRQETVSMERIEGLEEYPVILDHPINWGDMDAFAHVNNTVYFRHFENARIAYFEALGFTDHMKETGIGPILASTSCRFRIPLTYPDRVWIGGRAIDLDEDRFTMLYRVVSQQHGKVAAEGEGMIVVYDYRAGTKAPIPDSIREAIERLEGIRGE